MPESFMPRTMTISPTDTSVKLPRRHARCTVITFGPPFQRRNSQIPEDGGANEGTTRRLVTSHRDIWTVAAAIEQITREDFADFTNHWGRFRGLSVGVTAAGRHAGCV
jgi:hypothetical protein